MDNFYVRKIISNKNLKIINNALCKTTDNDWICGTESLSTSIDDPTNLKSNL